MGAKKIEHFPTILCITACTDKYCSIAVFAGICAEINLH